MRCRRNRSFRRPATALLRDMTAKFAPLEREGRCARLWRRTFYHTVSDDLIDSLLALHTEEARRPRMAAAVCKALGVSLDDPADAAARVALNYFGVTAARIEVEGRQWREAVPGEGSEALVVPVGGPMTPMADCLSLLGAHDLANEATPDDIGDLVALPLDGSRAVSMNGTTAAVGRFAPNDDGVISIATNGVAWLRQHVKRARDASRGAVTGMDHAIARSLVFPDRITTLLLDVRAFDWRNAPESWIARAGISKSICWDSKEVSDYIAGELKRKDQAPPVPSVRGPTK